MNALREVIGTYGIAVVCADCPDVIVGARRGSPLIVGVGEGENFLASDATAIAPHTRQVIYLNDYDVVTLTAERFQPGQPGLGYRPIPDQPTRVRPRSRRARALIPHFMLKEIFEQPRTVQNAMRGRIDHDAATAKFGGLNLTPGRIARHATRSSSPPAAPAGTRRWWANICSRNWRTCRSKSNTPANSAIAMPRSKRTPWCWPSPSPAKPPTPWPACAKPSAAGTRCWRICNVVGSTIAREADGGIYLHAGPEIGVASTKAFTSQVTVLALLALLMGRMRMLSLTRGQQIIQALEAMPKQIDSILAQNDAHPANRREIRRREELLLPGPPIQLPGRARKAR